MASFLAYAFSLHKIIQLLMQVKGLTRATLETYIAIATVCLTECLILVYARASPCSFRAQNIMGLSQVIL